MSAENMCSKYSRQELIAGWNQPEAIRKAKVTIVGVGALGSIVADRLVRAGVGTLYLLDKDIIEEVNLASQLNYTKADVNKTKVNASTEALEKINSDTTVIPVHELLSFASAQRPELFRDSDVIVDCLDNLENRLELNKICLQHKRPLVSGGVYGMLGQVQVVIPYETACLNCNPMMTTAKVLGASCSNPNGPPTPMLNSTTAIIGGKMAEEVYKLLHKGAIGKPLEEFFYYVGNENQIHLVALKKLASCTACGSVKYG